MRYLTAQATIENVRHQPWGGIVGLQLETYNGRKAAGKIAADVSHAERIQWEQSEGKTVLVQFTCDATRYNTFVEFENPCNVTIKKEIP